MSTTNELPTPETITLISQSDLMDVIIQLFRERDEAREKLKTTRRELTAANKGAERCSHINNSLAVRMASLQERHEKQLEAMRTAIKGADRSLSDLVEHIGECEERDLLRCDSDPHPPSVFSVYAQQASASLAKLQPFLP